MRENRSLSVLPDSEKIVSSNAGNNDVNEAIEQRDGLQHSSYLKLSLNCQSGLPINTTNVMVT